MSVSWDKIPVGKNLSHSFTLKAKKAGDYKTGRSQVTYSTKGGEPKTTYSSSLGTIKFYEWRQVNRQSGAHFRDWGTFLLFTLFVLSVPLGIYGYISPYL